MGVLWLESMRRVLNPRCLELYHAAAVWGHLSPGAATINLVDYLSMHSPTEPKHKLE